VLFEPNKNGGGAFEPFTIVSFNPAKCALAEENEVTGFLVAECLTEALGTGAKLCENVSGNLVTHLLQQAPAALFPSDVLNFGVNPALLDGVAAAKLSGANINKKWSGVI
jgi:hypothetical protein